MVCGVERERYSWFREAMEVGKLNETDLGVMTNIYISLFQGMLFWPQ
ncbi:hypothetical protein [Endozoicomonas sp. GU-1]|nr:hypothetical protein [Endozoicomonas sp. GU-1]WBA86106.1 hypothetical protein O3276_23350 [Endozoicomonas sp. GU-1]